VIDPQEKRQDGTEAGPERFSLVRAVPALIIALGVVAIAVALLIAAHSSTHGRHSIDISFGLFGVDVAYATPTLELVLAGLLTAVASVLVVQGLDAWAAKRVTELARQPSDAIGRPLRSEATRTRPPGSITVTAVIPARNEALHIGSTLTSLRSQTMPPTSVWVIADNCTDDTAEVASAHGASVYTTVENRHRKAGGLNQLLAKLLPTMGPFDTVLVMDADTVMVDDFLERAVTEFDANPDMDAVGGVFYGDDTPGLLAQMQRNEYRRYGRDISRRKGRVMVLTGTASLFRADALTAIATARGSVLPGEQGQVYDTYSLTEDNELTLAMKTLGARMVSPRECRVRTELMPTWRTLWNQRQRWQRGALENIGMYGYSSATARYWVQQFALGYGVIALMSFLVLSVLSWFASGVLVAVMFWSVLGILFAVERTATVWDGGWRARLLAAPLVIELCYSIVLQLVYVKSLVDIALGRSKHWDAATVAPVRS
jgi:cellulose synthase/poly-beta-1,6-N-acetylglucosamine synthase-like glycosyltransferase